MKTTKTIISIVLTFALLLSLAVTAPLTAGAAETEMTAADETSFVNCLNTVNSGSGDYVIKLTGDITHKGGFDVKNNLTILGEGHSIYLTELNEHFYISNGATLNLGRSGYNKTLTISGDDSITDYIEKPDNDNPGLLYIYGTSAVCNMYNNVTLKNHRGNNYFGGGVTVESGTFNMYGGTIDNCGIDGGSVCYGGGVAVFGKGTFIMNGGTISNCYALSDFVHSPDVTYTQNGSGQTGDAYKTAMGGGVFVTGESTFVMNDGTITGNKSTRRGGGISVSSCRQEGFGYIKSKVAINGGTISSNESNIGGGIYVNGYELPFANGITFNASVSGIVEVENTIDTGNNTSAKIKKERKLTGAGEVPEAGFNMTGGTISGNTANVAGGGFEIFRSYTKATIKNVTITNNTAKYKSGLVKEQSDADGYFHSKESGYGGGVLVSDEKSDLTIENCSINNNSSEKNGGGIAVITYRQNNPPVALVKDSTITGNTSGDRGAGVYYDDKSKLQVSGADIVQNNKYDNKLNNVNVFSTTNPIYVVGSLEGSRIGLSDPRLWDDGLSDSKAPDDGSAELLTNGYKDKNPEVHPDQYFTSDHVTWFVDRTKAEEKEIDDTSKRYYVYTAKRYPVTSGDNPAGLNYDYIRLEAQKPGTGAITTLQGIFDELVYRYSNKGYSVTYNYDKYKRYTAPDNTVITIQMQSSSVSLMFSKNNKSITYYGYTQYQSTASDGILYLKVSGSGDINNYTFSDTPDDELVTINYYPSTPFSNYIYEYDDLGKVTAKLVFEGGRYSYTTVYGKKTAVTGNENEVRLVRKQFDVNYHINNDDMSDIYANEIFTPYVTNHEVKEGNVIQEFHNIPKLKDPDGYVFKGWYYDRNNEDDSRPIKFGETYQSDDADKYKKGVDIYAHWEKVEKVAKDPGDDKVLPASMNNEYFNFGLFGVQIRPDYWADKNIDRYELQPGGLRFITSISEDLLSKIDALSDKKVKNDEGQEHDVEYGYVAARKDQVDMFANHYGKNTENYELRYKGADVNGEDTTGATKDAEHDYRYITNVDCTSHEGKVDHKSFDQYRLSTFVVTYKDADSSAHKDDQICARAYLRYYDANGLLRTFYNDYGGTTTYGGCCTSFTEAEKGLASNTNTYYKKEG